MKRTTSFLTLLLCSSIIFFGCTDDFDKEYTIELSNDLESEYQLAKRTTQLPDCIYPFGDYGNAKYIKSVSGVLIRKYDTLLIKFYDKQDGLVRLLDPCNLPRDYVKGQKIIFAGIEKIPPPYVRLLAPVIRLTHVKKKKP